MRRVLGDVLAGFGLFSIIIANLNARTAPNLPAVIGTFLPGLLLLIVGIAVSRRGRAEIASVAHDPPGAAGSGGMDQESRAVATALISRAEVGVLGGIVIMYLGGGIAQQGQEPWLGMLASLGGLALLIWGCGHYMRWKGYSWWFGLFGLLLLPGLAILACFPNRRKRALQDRALPERESVRHFEIPAGQG